jgi:hypothetical protein
MSDAAISVFISHSHDSPQHDARVLALADRLRYSRSWNKISSQGKSDTWFVILSRALCGEKSRCWSTRLLAPKLQLCC